jgi:hypothetical protein
VPPMRSRAIAQSFATVVIRVAAMLRSEELARDLGADPRPIGRRDRNVSPGCPAACRAAIRFAQLGSPPSGLR